MAASGRSFPELGRFRAGAALLAVALLLAGCGASSKGTAGPSGTSPTSAPGSTTSEASGSASTTTAAGSPTTAGSTAAASRDCPAASVVNAALGVHVASPTRSIQQFGVTCTYAGVAIPVRIVFQEDTRATFAAGEQAAAGAGGAPTTVTGLGDAAYGVYGFLAVLSGSTALRITAPLSTLTQVEGLARTILAS